MNDFDQIGRRVLNNDADKVAITDHLSFHDPAYQKRLDDINKISLSYKMSDPSIPRVVYNE